MRVPLRARDGSIRAFALIDVADAELVTHQRWYLSTAGYACRSVGRQKEYLHRRLLGLERGDIREADHISGNRLDNRRANLRIVLQAENAQNRSAIQKTSKHRGVTWYAPRRKWRAHAKLNGRLHQLGEFAREEDAARAAAHFRREHMPFAVPARDLCVGNGTTEGAG